MLTALPLSEENVRPRRSISGPVWSGEVRLYHNSEPSIEAPNSNTLSRQVKANPSRQGHTRTYGLGILDADANAGVVVQLPPHGPPEPARAGPQARPPRSANRPEQRNGFAPGTLVTGRNGPELRNKSGEGPAKRDGLIS